MPRRFRLASDARLQRWRDRFDAMPDWAFWSDTVRELRVAVENEILTRQLEELANSVGGYPGTWVDGWM